MGLAVRIIPTLLAKGTQLVKGRKFSADRVVGHVLQAARIHQARGVDELIIMDVTATAEDRPPDTLAIDRLSEGCFMPLAVGGGVRSLWDVESLLRSGADKVTICTAAMMRPRLIEECAHRFGCQAIVVSIDYRMITIDDGAKVPCVVSNSGTTALGVGAGADRGMATPLVVSRTMESAGAGEIILTCVDREGTMDGYDIDTLRSVAMYLDIPVIAHGGCSGPEDMLRAIAAGASAVAAGALFQFTDYTPNDCAQWLAQRGLEVRL